MCYKDGRGIVPHGVIQGKILSRLEDTDSVKYWQLAYYGLLVEMGGVEPPSKHRTR